MASSLNVLTKVQRLQRLREDRQQKAATSSRALRRARPRDRFPTLASYQARYLEDRSRRKLWLKARRVGGSFAVTLEAGMAAAGIEREGDRYVCRPDRGRDQQFVSASHRQAKLLLEEAAEHLEMLGRTVVGRRIIAQQSAERITLDNGVRLHALAPNPRTIRGSEGDVTLDEYAHMPRPDEVWAAAKAVTDPNLGRPEGYALRVVSTPFGDDNKFFKLCETDEGKRFSLHRVDIYEAIAAGFPRPLSESERADYLEELREEAGDADAFAEEYECVFLSARARYISAALWDAACYDIDDRPEGLEHATGFAGYDVARKPTGDLIAACELRELDDVLWQDAECWTERGLDWGAQEAKAAEILDRCARLGIDATGLGNQFAERLVSEHGGAVVPFEFTGPVKEELASGFRLALERGRLRPLAYDGGLRTAALSIRREVTDAGNVRYDAQRSKSGHADQAWACAMAVQVAGEVPTVRVQGSGRRRKAVGLRAAR